MIDPKQEDIGRRVRFGLPSGEGHRKQGIIRALSVERKYVFVRFEGEEWNSPMRPSDLEWAEE